MKKYNINPKLCYNIICRDNVINDCISDLRPSGCMYRMITSPPNKLAYKGYMPSHKEALDMLEKHDLLKGDREEYIKANCRYDKAKSQDERQKTEIKGITMRQGEIAIYTAIKEYFEGICEYYGFPKEVYEKQIDPDVIARNATIELEKAMKIYPNIK